MPPTVIAAGAALATVPGDPAALHDAAASLRATGGAADGVGRGLDHHHTAVPGFWTGAAASSFQTSVGLAATGSHEGGQALLDTSIVLEEYANTLEQAQQQTAALNTRMADADTALATALRGPGAGADPGAERSADAAEETHLAAVTGLRGQHEAILRELEAAAARARARLEAIAGRVGPIAGQSPEQIAQNVTTTLLTDLPVLREHPELVKSSVWAAMTAPVMAAAGVTSYKGGKWLAQLIRMRQREQLPVNLRALLGPGSRPPAPTWANSTMTEKGAKFLGWGLTRVAPGLGVGPQQLLGALKHPVVAGTTPSESLLKGSLRTLPQRAGLARGLGVVGGVAATGVSLANVVAQGSPKEAFERNGAEYVADVAEVGFNASMTALMVAPNPVTAGAAAVTGLVYLGAEAYAHREDIARLGAAVGSAAWDGMKATGEFAADLVGEAGDAIGDAASALNPFD